MSSYQEIGHDLRVLPCLSGLGDEELWEIGQMARLKSVEKNCELFKIADPVEFFFIVKDGAVKLYKTSSEGRELIVKIVGPGDYFCCAPIFSGMTHYVNAMTIEESRLIIIPASNFKEVLRRGMSELGMKIIAGLCGRIQFLSGLAEDLTFKDVERRVAHTLLRLTEERSAAENIINLALTHQDIASMTGTVREVVSRAMSKLKKDGIITHTSVKGFSIDRERLRDLIERQSFSPLMDQ